MMRNIKEANRMTVYLLCLTLGWILTGQAQDVPAENADEAPPAAVDDQAMDQDNDDLDFLFGGDDGEADAPLPPEAPMDDEMADPNDDADAEDDLDFLFDEAQDEQPLPAADEDVDGLDADEAPALEAPPAADVEAPDEAGDDPVDFLLEEAQDEAPAEMPEDAVPDEPVADDDDALDFLFGEPEPEPANGEEPADPAAADDLDFLFDDPAPVTDAPPPAAADDPQAEFDAIPTVDPAPPAAGIAEDEQTIPGEEPGDDEANLVAIQEEIRRQAFEIEARRRIAEAREAAERKEYREALNHFDRALQRMPIRPETEALLRSVQRERTEVLYHVLLEQVRTGTRDDLIAASESAERALQSVPDHRGLQRLISTADRRIEQLAPPPPPPPYESEEVQARRRRVRSMLDEGRGYLRNLDLQRAQELFESVLSIEPDNPEAMRYLAELHSQRYMISSLERESMTRDMVSAVRDTWRPREYSEIERPDGIDDPIETEEEGLIELMGRINIPEIEFRQANIHDVVEFLVRASVEGDPRPERRGVNIILNLRAGRQDQPAAATTARDPFADFDDAPAAAAPGDDITVTFTARYISLLQALQIITQVAGLKYHIEDNIVMIVPQDAQIDRLLYKMYPVEPSILERVEQDRATATSTSQDPFRTMGPGGIQRETPQVQLFFEQMGVPFPAGASISYNPSIGKLIVANTAENLVIFEKILGEVNVVPNQVEIEARFVEVNQTDLEEFGLQWLLDDNWQVLQRQGQGNLPLSARQRIEVQGNAQQGGFTRGLRFASTSAQLPVGAGDGTLGSLLTISSVLTNPEFSLIVNALAQKGHADVLSAPKVTTRAGQEANIRVVTEYIYPTEYEIREITGSVDGQTVVLDAFTIPSMFETREVGVILSVLPEVSPDGNMINLTLRPEVTDEPIWHNYGAVIRRADGSEQQTNMEQPFFPTRTLNTQISIYDGATVVMGGLITEHLISADDKIPLLGDIPLLGRLFRSTTKNSRKRNLLIFVTARLVDPAGRPVRQPQAQVMAAPTEN